jgi:hypothetical protein
MKKLSVVLFLLTLHTPLSAQAPNTAQMDQMKKVSFLVGQWKGEGWIDFGQGQRRFTETESVQSKLGGEVLLIEGLGKTNVDGKETGTTVHNAIALVTYDDKAKTFRFQAHQAGGRSVDSEARVTEGALEWGFTDERAGTFRFKIRLNDAGKWFEIGEGSRDGKTWHKFFEMTLQRE